MNTRRTVDSSGRSFLLTLVVLSKRSLGRPVLAPSGPSKDTWSWRETITERLVSRNESMPFGSLSDTGDVEAPKRNITPLVTGITAGLLVFFLAIILGWMYYRHVVQKARRKAQWEEDQERGAEKHEPRTKSQREKSRTHRSSPKSTLHSSSRKTERGERKRGRTHRPTSRPRAGPETRRKDDQSLSASRNKHTLSSSTSSTTLASAKSSIDREGWGSAHEPTRPETQTRTEPHASIQAYPDPSSRSGSVSSASGSTSSSDSERTKLVVDQSDKLADEVKVI